MFDHDKWANQVIIIIDDMGDMWGMSRNWL